MTVVGAPAPFRIAFDSARDPYTARNALGITSTGAGPPGPAGPAGPAGPTGPTGATGPTGPAGVVSATPPLALVGSTLSIDLTAYAPLASPALTGTPTTPTAAVSTSTTQIASTAFVRTGVTDGSTAAAGVVGQVVSQSVSLPVFGTSVWANVLTLSLPAGDWDVRGGVHATGAGPGGVWYLSISAISGGPTGTPGFISSHGGTTADIWPIIGPVVYNVAATTNIYLVANNATGSAAAVDGYLVARRIR